jgi:hypothetical protein
LTSNEEAATLLTFTSVDASNYAEKIAEADEKIAMHENGVATAKANLATAIEQVRAYFETITIGNSVGEYSGTYSAGEIESVFSSMESFYKNINSTTLVSDIEGYIEMINEVKVSYSLNKPETGEYFRVAYDYGGTIGKLYMQSVASSVKGLQFTSGTGSESIWLYDGTSLLSYKEGLCVKEAGGTRGLQGVGVTQKATFSISIRNASKYNIACSSYIHANSSGQNYFSDHCDKDGGHSAHDLILEHVYSLPVTFSAGDDKGYYSTFCAPVEVEIPTGVKAWYLTLEGIINKTASMTEITSVIPANTAVILIAEEAKTYEFTISNTNAPAIEGNLFKGTTATEYITKEANKEYYVLWNHETEGIGLFKDSATQLKNKGHKAYLILDAPAEGEAQNSTNLRFDFGGTTAIEEVVVENNKEAIYDLQGRRVSEITKAGIYIINGHKVFVK